MLALTLLRHAKSSWDDPDLADHERRLSKRGTKAAKRIGRYIAQAELAPDLIICSDAIRARATLALVLDQLEPPPPSVIITGDLYLAAPETILQTLRNSAGDARHVMVIGHNPGLHALALSLPMRSNGDSLADIAMKFPTAALAHLIFDQTDWADVGPATGHLARYVTPRSLAA